MEGNDRELGMRAFAVREWKAAFEHLSRADGDGPLEPVELEQLGHAAYLIGKPERAATSWTLAHNGFVDRGESRRAGRLGFWLSLTLLLDGKAAQSSGWLARTQRLLGETTQACSEQGLMLILDGLFSMGKGDGERAGKCFDQAVSMGRAFGDPDLMAMGVLGCGQSSIQAGHADEGLALLDEAMVTVTAGEVSPMTAGIVYCAVILTCQRAFDLRRAHEWTIALDDWCRSQPELIAFRGECLVHRSELLLLKGDWTAALKEARRAEQVFSGRSGRVAGRALYQQAEVHRLWGRFEEAEALYREAGLLGVEPQPGVSLLRLAQGNEKSARASIRLADSATGSQQGPSGGTQRIQLLGPMVEIMLAVDDVPSARVAADELTRTAAEGKAPYLNACAATAAGAVLLATGEAEQALGKLREAWTIWQQLEAPYPSACARARIARACQMLGDGDTARLHFDAAAAAFERLGARPDLDRLRNREPRARAVTAGLSSRERQVLSFIASGKTNREIATECRISEHTVARHVSNIFAKIDVTTRTAAAAFAFENGLVSSGHGQE
ncbi:LuxR C-terminal-related transcriptional regulator [Piscinibacter sp.]|uniref:LuxR C-terminal-related transcriptional regulator n=1 Tax=Piscinibacter sp. TaxID=1903157 RepID=UPI002B99942B|nr:LuxR C-terminal-related transcriptional regulator [Albitalea sp.]HUG25416.1 LuxR C-terminal-related transcriptional regulator [Albitalea sp.]